VILGVVRSIRVLATIMIAGACGLANASPASAVDEPMQGIYTYHQDGAPDETWTIYPTCVVAGCVLHISTVVSPHLGPDSDFPEYGQDARKVNGLWTLPIMKDKGAKCSDGSWARVNYTYAWDQATLAGTLTVINGEVCGLRPGMTKHPFTLTFKEPLPIPVILDPLNQIPELW
jgi:hypothetical protein